jgi:purine-binding chemotaxis protein CheW
MAKKRDRKVLGNDPFANGNNLLAEEGVGVPEGSGEKSEAEAKPKAKIKPEAESALKQVVADPDGEDSHLLDELMATIDEEVEEAFGPGAMADLASAKPVEASGEEQHIIFTLSDTEYTVSITNILEIGRPMDITPVPNTPDWVLGIANLRGNIISIVDLQAFLGMERKSYGQASRMLVAQARQADVTTGLIVDRVSGIHYLSADRIGAPAGSIEDQVAPYLRGIYEHDGHLLVVLDFDRLLLSPEMRQFEPG